MIIYGSRARAFDLAQVNIARAREPLDSPLLSEFVAALQPINALADGSPGFIWRLSGPTGDATGIQGFGDDRIIVNLSTWESLEALSHFVYKSAHSGVMRGRRVWFSAIEQAYAALWWVPSGHRPSVGEAETRLAHLREHGPSARSFTFKQSFPMPVAEHG
jgi:Domain of unknown function (DUF3291)